MVRLGKVTMQVIADHLGLSRFAVSRALSGGEGVSEKTRLLVLETAERLGYFPPAAQRFGDLFRHRNVLFLVERIRFTDRHFWPQVIQGVEAATRRRNLNLMFATVTEEQEANGLLPAALLEYKVDGVLAVGDFLPPFLNALREQRLPVVLVDMDGSGLDFDAVMTADGGGTLLAAKHLADLGHRRIGFIGDLAFASSFRRRFHGLAQARQELGIEAEEAQNLLEPTADHYWDRAGLLAALAEMPLLPTAFVCANDRVAVPLVGALQELNRRVPDDLSVVGFDNIDLTGTTSPPITTVHIFKEHMGERAIELLAWRLANRDHPRETVMIATKLVVRGSTGPPRLP